GGGPASLLRLALASRGAEAVGEDGGLTSCFFRPPPPAQDNSPNNADVIPPHVRPRWVTMRHKLLEKLRAQGMKRQKPQEDLAPEGAQAHPAAKNRHDRVGSDVQCF